MSLLLVGCEQAPSANAHLAAQAQRTAPRSVSAPLQQLSSSPLRMTCHPLLAGRPSPEPTTYELRGDDLFSIEPDGYETLISTEGKLVSFGKSEDEQGPTYTSATHSLQGHVVTRTVYWQRPGKRRTAFAELFDFDKQTVRDRKTSEDSCYHNARPDGRTQEQAILEGMESLRGNDGN